MTKIKKLTCTCCGGTIDRIKQRCVYCGTQYKIEDDSVVRIETFTNPVREFSACSIINREDAILGGEEYMKFVLEQLCRAMMPAVLDGMQIRIEDDLRKGQREIKGRLKVVIPMDKGKRYE